MNKMDKFKETSAMCWGEPVKESSGTHDELDVRAEHDAGKSETKIVDFILDSYSLRDVGFIQENMENGFKMFIRNNGCQPDYAICAIVWNDGSIYPEVNIRLSQTVNPATDDDIFFYCDGLKELKSLVFPGGKDFCIADILYFKGLCRRTPNKKHDTKCHPHFLQQR